MNELAGSRYWDAALPGLEFTISKPVSKPDLRVLSFGAGVQSTVLALLGLRGAFGPPPDVLIFADTMFEPRSVYRHIEWMKSEVKRLSNGRVEVAVVSAGDLRKDHINGLNSTGQRVASMPLFTAGGKGMGRRQCTREYKIQPIEKEVRRILGVGNRKRVHVTIEMWIGISTDEISRLKYNPRKWAINRWPLIEARMTRADCRAWFEREYPERPLVKSACSACPFRDNAAWRDLKKSDPEAFADAVSFDAALRHQGSKLKGMNEQQFVHRSGVPLSDADLEAVDADDLFEGECDGMCGV